MIDWHVVPDRSVGKAGVQVYRNGKYIMRLALAELGIPEREMGLLCHWLPKKIGSLLEPKEGCSKACGCGKPEVSQDVQDADVPDPFAKEIVPATTAAGNEQVPVDSEGIIDPLRRFDQEDEEPAVADMTDEELKAKLKELSGEGGADREDLTEEEQDLISAVSGEFMNRVFRYDPVSETHYDEEQPLGGSSLEQDEPVKPSLGEE